MNSFDVIDSSMIANRDQIRSASYGANGLVTVDFDKITIRINSKGRKFNRRTVFEGIVDLAASIASEELQEPLKVDILSDGTIVLNDGERRVLAIRLIRSWSPEWAAKFAKVKCLVNDKSMTDTDRVFQQHISNGGEPFPVMDEAESFKELRDGLIEPFIKLTPTQIAERAGKSVPYVAGRLALADASDEEKKLMSEGKVSPTTIVALGQVEADPEARVKRIREANSKGVKLKVKNVKNAPGVVALENIITKIDAYLDEWEPTGEHKNIFLEIRSLAGGVIKTIE